VARDPRVEPPPSASEKETLEAFLDYHRQTVVLKCAGVPEEELRRAMVVSGTSMLGIVKHLGFNERWWFQEVFAARDVQFPWNEADPDTEFRIEEHETAESVIDFYVQECDKSRAIIAEASLDDVAENSKSGRSLRWILFHMFEETSRHNGHLDILREMIDGTTGD